MKNKNLVKIETYKGIDLFYNKDRNRINFGFEGVEREAKYIFEAQQIIDEPVWEDCDLKGYIIDGVFNDYIGKAIATRKDIKSGKPDWKIKGEYDTSYKETRFSENLKVYPLNKKSSEIYENFKIQKDIVSNEKVILKNIINQLNNS